MRTCVNNAIVRELDWRLRAAACPVMCQTQTQTQRHFNISLVSDVVQLTTPLTKQPKRSHIGNSQADTDLYHIRTRSQNKFTSMQIIIMSLISSLHKNKLHT